jgi:hypothetical protein
LALTNQTDRCDSEAYKQLLHNNPLACLEWMWSLKACFGDRKPRGRQACDRESVASFFK